MTDPAAAVTTATAATTGTPAAVTNALITPTTPADGAPLISATQVDENAWLPEKFRVLGEDGKVDTTASAQKLAESNAALEARMGAGDIRPKTVDEYQITAGEGTEKIDFDAFMGDPLSKDFVAKAHAEGFTNKQLNFAINEYLKVEQGIADVGGKITAAQAKTDLGKLWGDAEVDARLATVDRSIKAFGTTAEDMPGSPKRLYEKFGSDPDFIAFAAAVAAEVKPDGNSPTGAIAGSDADVEALQKSKAYWDTNDPQHAIVKERVKSHFDRKNSIR